MRIQYLFIPVLTLWLMPSFSFANTQTPTQPAKAQTEEDTLPDAMSRLVKAPNIDIEKIRDPFLSSFEKNRMEEAKRYKTRTRLSSSKRKREVLEFFDLSTLTIVGTYQQKGKGWVASVQDSTGKGYTVRRGNYIGKRSGRIEKIDDKTIYLVEQVVNPAGDLVDRQVTLTLEEVNK